MISISQLHKFISDARDKDKVNRPHTKNRISWEHRIEGDLWKMEINRSQRLRYWCIFPRIIGNEKLMEIIYNIYNEYNNVNEFTINDLREPNTRVNLGDILNTGENIELYRQIKLTDLKHSNLNKIVEAVLSSVKFVSFNFLSYKFEGVYIGLSIVVGINIEIYFGVESYDRDINKDIPLTTEIILKSVSIMEEIKLGELSTELNKILLQYLQITDLSRLVMDYFQPLSYSW